MNDLGVAIVGCGNISTIYMLNIPKFNGVRLVACADLRPEVAKAQADKFGIEAAAIDDLLKRDDVDIIVNLTTPLAHFDVSHAALTAGKHVFSEKPLTVEAEHAKRLLNEAQERGLEVACAPDTFLGAGGRLVREIVDAGKVGRILTGTCFLMSHGMEHWHPDPEFFFKRGGGPVFDMGPYYLAALVGLLGPVAKVRSITSTGFPERIVTSEGPRKGQSIAVETPTTAMALLSFANGTDINFCMSWDVWRHGHPPIELYGTEGSLRIPDPNFYGGEVQFTDRGGEWQIIASHDKPLGAPNWPVDKPAMANYRGFGVAELAQAVRNGVRPRASGLFAAHIVEIMDAILQAGSSGDAVVLSTTLERPEPLSDELVTDLTGSSGTA